MSQASLAIRMKAETLRSLAFGSISGTYAGIGTALANPARIIHITNTTDVLLTYSLDGVNDHFIVPTNSFLLLDITTNQAQTLGCFLSQGDRLYVKGAPTLGSTYLSVFYGSNA
jgi:hypothetical protein